MNDEDAYRLIGERAQELSNVPKVQKKMMDIFNRNGKQDAEKFLYSLAIATLAGI